MHEEENRFEHIFRFIFLQTQQTHITKSCIVNFGLTSQKQSYSRRRKTLLCPCLQLNIAKVKADETNPPLCVLLSQLNPPGIHAYSVYSALDFLDIIDEDMVDLDILDMDIEDLQLEEEELSHVGAAETDGAAETEGAAEGAAEAEGASEQKND